MMRSFFIFTGGLMLLGCVFGLLILFGVALPPQPPQPPRNPYYWDPQGKESLRDFTNRQPEVRDPAWQAYADCRQRCDFDGVERGNRDSALHTLDCHRQCKPLEKGARATGETWAPDRRPSRFPVEVTEEEIRSEQRR